MPMITRSEATEQILAAKQAKGLTFEAIAEAVGRHKVWVTAALMGQATMSAEEAHAAVQVLGLGSEVAEALQQIPMKGSLESAVPVDPLIYRFHEITEESTVLIKESLAQLGIKISIQKMSIGQKRSLMTQKQVDMAVYDWRPWVPDAGYFIY
jgi:cyanate lyase